MQCTCSPLCYCHSIYNFPLCYQLLPPPPPVTVSIPSVTITVPSVTRYFSEFPFTVYVNNNKILLLNCKLPWESNLGHIMWLEWEKTRQVSKIQCPLCYFMYRLLLPCPLCYTLFSLFILFNNEDFYNHCSSFDSAKKWSLNYGVSCYSIRYLLFANDKSASFRDA